MAIGNRRFDRRLSTFTIFASATAVAVAVLAYQPDLAAGNIPPVSTAADRMVTNQLAVFLEPWTKVVNGNH